MERRCCACVVGRSDRAGPHDSLPGILVRLQQAASARNPELACRLCVWFTIGERDVTARVFWMAAIFVAAVGDARFALDVPSHRQYSSDGFSSDWRVRVVSGPAPAGAWHAAP